MTTYDWIVIGAGITGAALAYELAKQGLSVLLLERQLPLAGATRYSYGGIAYWSGTTPLTRQLCQESMARYPNLSEELEADIQFRELDLVLTIAPESNSQQLAANYAQVAIPPKLISVAEACELEPLLNPAAIAGALTVRHGHIEAELTAQAYYQAMKRLGGTLQMSEITGLLWQGDQVTGVTTATDTFQAHRVAVCAGGLSRHLLEKSGIRLQQYFTHSEVLETEPVDLRLRTLVMPAEAERFDLEWPV